MTTWEMPSRTLSNASVTSRPSTRCGGLNGLKTLARGVNVGITWEENPDSIFIKPAYVVSIGASFN